jgi:hypothetical protein
MVWREIIVQVLRQMPAERSESRTTADALRSGRPDRIRVNHQPPPPPVQVDPSLAVLWVTERSGALEPRSLGAFR